MAKMGDWRDNKDDEIELDGIGGVNIVVKADVHKSGKEARSIVSNHGANAKQALTSHVMHSKTRLRLKASPKWQSEQATQSLACQTTWCGILTQKRSLEMRRGFEYIVRKGNINHNHEHKRDVSMRRDRVPRKQHGKVTIRHSHP
jgi:hypothetical protein